MAAVTVRFARADDAEGFVRAYELSWNSSLGPIAGRTLDELSPFADRLASFASGIEQATPDVGVFVAERDGAIVGVAVVGPESSRTSELRALYVIPDAWASGVAALLLERALQFMRSRNSTAAVLWVVVDNSRARRFYEREGWHADGRQRVSSLGPSELRYTRRL